MNPSPIRAFGDRFSRACGLLGLLGILASVVTSLVGVWVHDRVGFVAETISDLAAGRHAWIQDLGLYALALGMVATAAALWRGGPHGLAWRVGTAGLIVLAIIIAVIGGYGEYGDLDEGGVVIHIYLVIALGVGFPAVVLLLTPGLRRFDPAWGRWNALLAVVWIVAAPLFFLVPTGWDGLYERGVALLLLVWLAALARLLMRPRRYSARRRDLDMR